MKSQMRFILFTAIILWAISLNCLADTTRTGIYNTPAVNLRTCPSTQHNSLGLVHQGATCEIIEELTVGDTIWYYVKITCVTANNSNLEGKVGWSKAEFIQETTLSDFLERNNSIDEFSID